ncbi:MAG: hypothetical protein V1912_00070 [bacterium]
MKTLAAGPFGVLKIGQVADVDAKTAEVMVANGYAEYVASQGLPLDMTSSPDLPTAMISTPDTASAGNAEESKETATDSAPDEQTGEREAAVLAPPEKAVMPRPRRPKPRGRK